MSSIIYEHGKKFSRAGILTFMPSSISNTIANQINNILMRTRTMKKPEDGWNEIFTIFSQNLSQDYSQWSRNIASSELELLEEYITTNYSQEEKEKILSYQLKPYVLLEKVLEKINNLENIKLESIIGIEPAKPSPDHVTQNYYNFFGGRYDQKLDKGLRDTAIRETREEGLIKFHNNIFNHTYQKNVRNKFGLNDLPMSIEYCVNEKSGKNHRSYLIVTDDNIDYSFETDENGLYILVKSNTSDIPIYKKNYIEEDGKLFTKVGVIPFMSKDDSDSIARVIDSHTAVKMNNLIRNIKDNRNDYFANDTAGIISDSIFNDDKNWQNKITLEQKDRVDRLIQAESEDKKISNEPWTRNKTLEDIINLIKKSTVEYTSVEKDWQNLLKINPIRQKNKNQEKTNFGCFIKKIDKRDKILIEVAKNEMKEEACIYLNDFIFTGRYQSLIRERHKIKDYPLYVDVPYYDKYDKVTYHSRIYLLFMENVKISLSNDLYVKLLV